MIKKNVGVLIPVYNEEKNLKKVIQKAKKFSKVFVIDDASTDNSYKIAKENSNKVFRNKKRLGYDSSIKLGLKKISHNYKDIKYLISLDGDGQHVPSEIPKFLKIAEHYNIVIGKRSFYNRYSEYFSGYIFKLLLNIRDPLSGMKMYNLKKINNKIPKLKVGSDEMGLFFIYLAKKSEITEIFIDIKAKNKESSIGDGLSVNLRIIKASLKILCKKILSLE